MKLCYSAAASPAPRYCFGAIKPAFKLDPGFLEHLRLSPRAAIGLGARLLEFLFMGLPAVQRA